MGEGHDFGEMRKGKSDRERGVSRWGVFSKGV